jgi:hypothetical protein
MSRYPAPHTDDDTFDVLDDALAALAERLITTETPTCSAIHVFATPSAANSSACAR